MTASRALLVLAVVVAALAAAPASASAQDDEASTDSRASVAVFLLSETPLPARSQANLTRALESELKKNDRVEVKDKDLLLAEFGGEVPEAKVAAARQLFGEGVTALDGGQASIAVEKLSAAEAAFEPVLAFVKKNELADAQFMLGVAHARAGEKKKARAVFLRLQVWRPTYQWDVERHAGVLPLWEAAKQELAGGGRGSLEILSEPEGAMAFVDGKYVGVTPAAVDGLPIGDHYVTLKLEGYQRRVVKAHVDPRYQELVTEALPRSEKYLLVEQSLARTRDHLGAPRADVAMVDLRTFLFLDMAVFVKVSPGRKKGAVRVDAYLYDLRSKKRLGEATGAEVEPDAGKRLDEQVGQVVRALFTGVRYDGQTEVVSRRKPAPPGPAPYYKRWWFWTAVAVGTAAVVTPIVFADELFPPAPPSCGGGEVCTGLTTGF